VTDHTGRAQLVATKSFAQVPTPDVIVIPGGRTGVLDQRLVDWTRAVHPSTTWTTSVCTGSIYLATAGLLDGADATTHWAWVERLEELGARYRPQRVVEHGNIITAAGVSSGIDMALALLDRMHGPAVAQSAQLALEYAGWPPASEWANSLPEA
jgi:transcriptional regulator GlxA family with amidase domain